MSLLDVFNISSSAMKAQATRLNTVASNMANADSVVSADGQPYKAKQVIFKPFSVPNGVGQGVNVEQVVESNAPSKPVFDPTSPFADANGMVQKSNVDVVEEMTNMISAARSYQTNAEVMNQAKTMMLKTLQIGNN